MPKKAKTVAASTDIRGFLKAKSRDGDDTPTAAAEDDSVDFEPVATETAARPKRKQASSSSSLKQDNDGNEMDQKLSEEARAIKKGEEPDIGVVVKARVKGKWYTGQIVKHDRHGISKKYAVKGLVVIFDRDIPTAKKTFDVDSEDILVTNQVREVRYWSSGTPCMRATGVDTHCVVPKDKNANSLESAAKNVALSSSPKKKKMTLGKPQKYSGKQQSAISMTRADTAALKLLQKLENNQGSNKKQQYPSTEEMTKIFEEIGEDWPTQDRPNVTPNGKPVTGFCLGCVFVLGGGGMQTSNVSLAFPNLCKCITSWVKGSLPESDFPFSSIQINYNYMAKKHVDGNNIGPSYIFALGDHQGGDLWTADTYISSTDPKDGSKMVRSGGGEALLTCRNKWALFNGNMEHETQPIQLVKGKASYTRISVIVFSNSNYNLLPPYVVDEMEMLGFTAQSSSGEDLPYFKKYRLDKKEFTAAQNKSYISYLMQRSKELPPPIVKGRVCVECFGLTMNRGGGWMSVKSDDSKADPEIFDLEPNRTGFHVLELECLPNGNLRVVSQHINNQRFNIYKDEVKEVARFSKFIHDLPPGRIVLITITDTAIAAKRPPGKELYEALALIGGSLDMERIGYRQPFALIGYKGMSPGSANHAMDKTKILLRLEATVVGQSDDASTSASTKKCQLSNDMNSSRTCSLVDYSCERTDVNELKLTDE